MIVRNVFINVIRYSQLYQATWNYVGIYITLYMPLCVRIFIKLSTYTQLCISHGAERNGNGLDLVGPRTQIHVSPFEYSFKTCIERLWVHQIVALLSEANDPDKSNRLLRAHYRVGSGCTKV